MWIYIQLIQPILDEAHYSLVNEFFLPINVNAAARDSIMWLPDSIFFIVVMPKFLLIVAIFLDLSKAKNGWHLPASNLLSKYCFIIWEEWRRIVRLDGRQSALVHLYSFRISLSFWCKISCHLKWWSDVYIHYQLTTSIRRLNHWTWLLLSHIYIGSNIVIELFTRLSIY